LFCWYTQSSSLAVSAALRRATGSAGSPSTAPPSSARSAISAAARPARPAPTARRAWPASACIARRRRNAIGAIEVRLVIRSIVSVLVLDSVARKLIAALDQNLLVVVLNGSNIGRCSNAARSVTVSAAMSAILADLWQSELGPLLAQHGLA
jgi:hypothetical protein